MVRPSPPIRNSWPTCRLLLLAEIAGGEQCQARPIAEAGQAECLAPRQNAPAAELVRAIILDIQVDLAGSPGDDDLADDLAPRSAGGLQSQPDVEPGKIAGKEQIRAPPRGG